MKDDRAKEIGTSSVIIGRYERNEITPSVEVATKIADALEVSLDYLVGSYSFLVKDKKSFIAWSCWIKLMMMTGKQL